MKTDARTLLFGQYLKTERLKRGIELEAVARETRISLERLQHLEEEVYDRLPAQVYVRGFLRAYAQAVGIDPAEVQRRYAASLAAHEHSRQADADLARQNRRFWQRIFLALGLLTVIVTVSTLWVTLATRPRPATVSPVTAVGEATGAPQDAGPAAPTETVGEDLPEQAVQPAVPLEAPAPPPAPAPAVAPAAGPEKVRLKILAVEETWLKITIDDRPPKAYTLKPTAHLELEAEARFRLLVGNAGGIKLLVNDNPMAPLGRSGEVVKVRIP